MVTFFMSLWLALLLKLLKHIWLIKILFLKLRTLVGKLARSCKDFISQ